MTAIARERHGGSGALWLIAIVVAGLLLLASVGGAMEGIAVSLHAEERHGAAAVQAEAYLKSGGPFKREPCRDGKEMWTWTQGRVQWLAIVRGDTIVTMFETDAAYLQSVRKRDGCGDGPRWGSHDMPSAQ